MSGGSHAPGGRLEGVPLNPWAAGAQARVGLRFAHHGCSPAGGLAPWGLFPHLSSLPSSTLSPCPQAPGWAAGGDAPPRACGPSGFTARRTPSVRVGSPGSPQPPGARFPGPHPAPCQHPERRARPLATRGSLTFTPHATPGLAGRREQEALWGGAANPPKPTLAASLGSAPDPQERRNGPLVLWPWRTAGTSGVPEPWAMLRAPTPGLCGIDSEQDRQTPPPLLECAASCGESTREGH